MFPTETLEAACAPYASLAIAGTAKNAGKTTALNYLIERFAAAGEALGLSSVGRDGEAVDQLTNRAKPRIRPPVGALVATAHESALYSQATLRRVAETPYRTALGPVGIYRVEGPGYVEVAGPVKVREAAALNAQLAALGCDRVLLDGAADRRAFVAAGVDAFVLATGLVVRDDAEGVIAETRSVLERLTLPQPPAAWAERCGDAPGAITAGGFVPWTESSLLSGLQGFGAWLPADAEALCVPGALGDALADVLLTLRRPLGLIVPAGTHLLAGREKLDRLYGRGFRAYALTPLRCAALTVNPTSPHGAPAEAGAFLARLREAFPGLPVFDVLGGALAGRE